MMYGPTLVHMKELTQKLDKEIVFLCDIKIDEADGSECIKEEKLKFSDALFNLCSCFKTSTA
jgi:hypothetical protein